MKRDNELAHEIQGLPYMQDPTPLVRAAREQWQTDERERVVGLFEALCNNDPHVASVAAWIREGEL